MVKKDYAEANRRWLEEKAKEEGVKALPRGIYYKVLKAGDASGPQPSRPIIRGGQSTARSLTPVEAVLRSQCD